MKRKVYVRDLKGGKNDMRADCPIDLHGDGWYSLDDNTGWFVKGERATYARIWIPNCEVKRLERLAAA